MVAGAALLAFCIAVLFAAPASADGLILDVRPVGDAGLQLDAAVISPLPSRSGDGSRGVATAFTSSETYTIQPGDTLAAIAGRFDMGASALASLNGITNPDRIIAGQVLKVGAAPQPAPALSSDGPLARVQFWPWPPAQGQTLAVWLEVRQPMTLSVTLDGRAYPVVTHGRHGWALIPIPPLVEPGIKSLSIDAGGARAAAAGPHRSGRFPFREHPARGQPADPLPGGNGAG